MTVGQPENLIYTLSGSRKSSTQTESFGLLQQSNGSTSFQSLMDSLTSIQRTAHERPRPGSPDSPYDSSAAVQAIYTPDSLPSKSVGSGEKPASRSDSVSSDAKSTHSAGSSSSGISDGSPASGGGEKKSGGAEGTTGSKDSNPAQDAGRNSSTQTVKGTPQETGGSAKPADAGKKAGSLVGKVKQPSEHAQQDVATNNSKKTKEGARNSAALHNAEKAAGDVGKVVNAAKNPVREGATHAQRQPTIARVGDLVGNGKLLAVHDLRSGTNAATHAVRAGSGLTSTLLNALHASANGSSGGKAGGNGAGNHPGAQHSHSGGQEQVQSVPRAGSEIAQELVRMRQQVAEQAPSDRHRASEPGTGNSQGILPLSAGSGAQAGQNARPVSAPQSAAYTELARQLRENLNTDIVREAKVTLKDQNSGEIKMTLRPESLGRVRIKLHIVDNRIGGQIFVDNKNVKEVFQQNLNQLYQAFQDSGFDTGMLEVAVGNDGGQELQHRQSQSQPGSQAARIASIGMLEGSVPRLVDASYGESLVNLVV